jgi:hypothetical protein
VLDTLGVAQLLVDPKVLTVDEMLNAIGECYERRVEIQTILGAKMPEVKTAILNLFPMICNRTRQSSLDVLGSSNVA